jgi:hypothetical protein
MERKENRKGLAILLGVSLMATGVGLVGYYLAHEIGLLYQDQKTQSQTTETGNNSSDLLYRLRAD